VKRTLIAALAGLAAAAAVAGCQQQATPPEAKAPEAPAAVAPAPPQAPAQSEASTPGMPAGHPAPTATAGEVSGIATAEGGKTVAEIFAAKTELAGQEILLRGKVVKFNGGIMGKNWLHVQDGTGAAGTNDLTVTTDAPAKVGDTVLIKGKLATDKDFGSGYKYAVIVEEAAVTVE